MGGVVLKNFLRGRAVQTAIKAAEKVDVAWTVTMAVNTVVIWGANVLLYTEATAPVPANDVAIELPVAQAEAVAPISPAVLPQDPKLFPLAEPSQAVWRYLCNRDVLIQEAAKQHCPTVTFGKGDLLTLGPLKRDERDAVYGRQHANDNHEFDAPKEGQDQ
jgi:hypothetical protein